MLVKVATLKTNTILLSKRGLMKMYAEKMDAYYEDRVSDFAIQITNSPFTVPVSKC